MLDLEQSTYFFLFALCSVRWDPVDWKHCPRYWWPCLWCMYCFMIIPKSSFFLTQKKKSTSPQNNMPFHSLSPCSKISWFPVSDKLGETLITLISQKSEDFLFQIKLWHLLHKINLNHHLYLLSNSRFLLYSVGSGNVEYFRLYCSKNKNRNQVRFWYEKHLCLSLKDF